MALTQEQQIALANEARRNAAQTRVYQLLGTKKALQNTAAALSSMSMDADRQLQSAKEELTSLELGTGPGLAADFGAYSEIEQAMRVERFAGKGAAIDYVKLHPTCTEATAISEYRTAALAARPADRKYLLIDAYNVFIEYRKGAYAWYVAGKLPSGIFMPDDTWESFRDNLLLPLPKDDLMNM